MPDGPAALNVLFHIYAEMRGHSYYMIAPSKTTFCQSFISGSAEPNAKLFAFIIKHGFDFHCCPYKLSKLTHIWRPFIGHRQTE